MKWFPSCQELIVVVLLTVLVAVGATAVHAANDLVLAHAGPIGSAHVSVPRDSAGADSGASLCKKKGKEKRKEKRDARRAKRRERKPQ